MTDSYQILFLDADGRVAQVIGKCFADDEAAVIWLADRSHSYIWPLELWYGGRRLKAQQPSGEAAADGLAASYLRGLAVEG